MKRTLQLDRKERKVRQEAAAFHGGSEGILLPVGEADCPAAIAPLAAPVPSAVFASSAAGSL